MVRELLKDGGEIMCLIKPQFEAGKGKVGKKGVVREPEIHREVIEKILALMAEKQFRVMALDYSPIKGPEGNIEYLIYAVKDDNAPSTVDIDVKSLVSESHAALS